MKIAHVGFTGSQNDLDRILEVLYWLEDNGHESSSDDESDFLDLTRNRDFLLEQKQYDVVVLHFIYRGGISRHLRENEPAYTVSPLSSWSGWRKRLVETNAKFIFAFGGPVEIGGPYLANLNGYKIHKIRTETLDSITASDKRQHGLWIFEKA